jgi:hypothetical protein
MKKTLIRCIAAILLVLSCFFVNQYLRERYVEAENATGRRGYDPPVEGDHPALLWFGQAFENREAFLGFASDLTGDGLDDVIILFREDLQANMCWMCVAVGQSGGGWMSTEAVRAPVENQKIRVFDMDQESPLEYVITGEKDGRIGYAIYRLIDGALTDLFVEDMDECC